MNGIVPRLDFKWNDCNLELRNGKTLKYPNLVGNSEGCKTMQKRSLSYEGVRLFNSIPEKLRTFSGKQEHFKKLLDMFLSEIPDCPETGHLIPEPRNKNGQSSNSIPDWLILRPQLRDLPQDAEMFLSYLDKKISSV